MPHVIIQTVKGILDNEQKKQLLEKITDVLVEVEGKGNPPFARRSGSDLTSRNRTTGCAVVSRRRRNASVRYSERSDRTA